MRLKLFVVVLLVSVASTSLADSRHGSKSFALEAVSENAKLADAAIAALRSQGAAGLSAFLDAHDAELKTRQADIEGAAPRLADQSWKRLSAALDRVCQQRDCYSSRLYWYTDLDQAKTAARSSGKPILSLRLLGRLDEELSCANSRFFRIALYANAEVSDLLRERFILHWQSVRDVPRVTIDFGDGRKLERTLTGNSIHYILDSEGRPVDALPGLYGPRAFIKKLRNAESAAVLSRTARTDVERIVALSQYHAARLSQLSADWELDLMRAGIPTFLSRDLRTLTGNDAAAPRAEVAAPRAMAKAAMERPVLRGISSSPRILDETTEDPAWASLAAMYAEDARLDENSKILIRNKNLAAYGSSDSAARAALKRAVSQFERAIAQDSVRNEYVFHTRIHEWFAGANDTLDLVALNDKVYAELFLTPASDPWLGLLPRNAYAGIENDGIRK